ncbi:hypothetical protein CCP3SC1AL1_2210013 [Gammaproteobacteria bacterium]
MSFKVKGWKRTFDSNKYLNYSKTQKIMGKCIPNPQKANLSIYPPKYNRSYWEVVISKNLFSSPFDFKQFKTKAEALAFAKKYMQEKK